jgi:ATP-binding cassette subfamily B protein
VGATERIREILATAQELEVSPGGAAPSLALRGNIEFRDVHFEYPTRPDLPVLKGLNFAIQAGEKVALVGPSGAGKSTVVQLLLRLYDLQSGKLLVDGEPASDYDLSAYRRNFALVPQEVMLFGGTIRENILYGRGDATDEEIIEAARQANALEFIEEFPDGFGTIVGERGVKLSGGQRQRIAIARAILRDPAILLLDEATSSLDAESERVVQDALDKLLQGRTALIIAHRLSTIRDADRILVIDKGRLVEEGRHDELFANEDGLYHHLARLQFEEKV